MKGRMITGAFVGASLAATCAWGAISATGAAASVPPGYTQVAQSSVTYTPGGDVGTFCDGAVAGYGFGGGCFTPSYTATYVDASLSDQATQNTAGEIQFQSGANAAQGATTLATVNFCGDSGPVAIPTGTSNIFVVAAGPLTNQLGPNCGASSFATTGTATLTQLVQTTTTTTTTATTT